LKIIFGLDSPELEPRPRVVAMGAYDGVHLGHRAILDIVCAAATERGLESTALTFEPIPLEVFGPQGSRDVRLTLLDEKVELLERQCLHSVVVADFNEAFRNISARDFTRDILVGRLGTKLLVASETHTFGRGGEANVTQMRELGREFGFEVLIPPLLAGNGGQQISSTGIRGLLRQGDVQRAAALLGRPYCLRGTVVTGRGIGTGLGFPTANLDVPVAKLIPADGVYAAVASWEGGPSAPLCGHRVCGWPAAVSIGTTPTFGGSERLIEAHLLDVAAGGSFVGARMELHLVAYIREQRKFAGAAALSAQISRDIAAVRAALGGTAAS
jgi:riboflavin kinase / FMN adenylyltransferase